MATFNLLHGMTVADGVVDTERLRESVRMLDPDILGLQEVDRDQARSNRVDQTAVAAAAMGAVAHRFVPAIAGTPASLRELPMPQLLTGDLNFPGPLPRILGRWQPLVVEKTFPLVEPKVQLDHVLGHGDLPAPTDAGAPRLPLSDHRAAYVDLDL